MNQENCGPSQATKSLRTCIDIRNLEFSYPGGGFRLDISSLQIQERERVAFIGPSGTGKTTLVHLIAGILVPHKGKITLQDREISSLSDARRRSIRISRIGMVFQEFELLEYLSAFDNILLPYFIAGELILTDDVKNRAHSLAHSMGLGKVLKRPPKRLSQGERQRVALCRALVADPEVILCDEPTGNLDPTTSNVILDLLFEQLERRGATLLMVTHNHDILHRFTRTIDINDLIGAHA